MSTAQPTFDDVWRMFQETGRQFQEQSRETDRLMKEASRETDRKFQETDRKIKEVTIQIGHLGNRLGDFVEEMVRPAVVRLFRDRGLDVRHVMRDLTAYDDHGRMLSQVDLLAVDTDVAVAVECKSQLSIDDVNEHLERLETFKAHFPQYAAMRILGAVVAMVLPEDVARYAYRQGLYVIGQTGDHLMIRNDDKFRPKIW